MKNRRDYVDAYTETLVLPQETDSVRATSGGDRDPLALYEEYARELTSEVMVPSRHPQAPRKR